MTLSNWSLWALLVLVSAALAFLLGALRIPAALLLGPMLAGIVLAGSGIAAGSRALFIPRHGFELAQAIVGTMIGGQIPMTIIDRIGQDWPSFIIGVISVVGVAYWLGYSLAKRQVLPGTSAIWGASPGAAQAMVFLAEAHGADMRLVAVMQYLRVGLVAAGASVIARLTNLHTGAIVHDIDWFPPPDFKLLAAVVVITLGFGAAKLVRIPAGTFLLPLLIGAVMSNTGNMTPTLPEWLLALAYAAIGWMIGLRFTRDILRHAARALPRLVVSVLALMGLCGVLAAALVLLTGVDPLTAYLATSPGGADSIAIIAAASHVDMAFVMAMQTTRFIVVLATGPMIARWFARRIESD